MDPPAPSADDGFASVLAHRTLNSLTVVLSGLRTLPDLEPSLSPASLDLIDRCVTHGEVAVEALRILMLGTSDTTLPPLPDY